MHTKHECLWGVLLLSMMLLMASCTGGRSEAQDALDASQNMEVQEAARSTGQSFIDDSLMPLKLQRTVSTFRNVEASGTKLRYSYATLTPLEYSAVPQLWGALDAYCTGETHLARLGWEALPRKAEKVRAAMAADGIPFDGTFSNERDIYVRRADSLVLSFVECDTLHEGMDGMVPTPQNVWGRNYDARTGKALTLSDVFTDASKLAAAIEERLRSDYPYAAFAQDCGKPNILGQLRKGEQIVKDNMGGAMHMAARQGAASWTLENEGATFYFNPTEIAPGREGIYAATILFSEHPELFREEYRHGRSAYCLELPPGIPVRTGADGESASVVINGVNPCVAFGSSRLNSRIPVVAIRPVLAVLADGRRYIYVDCTSEFGMHGIEVFDLDRGTVKRVNPRTMLASIPSQKPAVWWVMTDPDDFMLNMTMPEGVANGPLERPSHIGADGTPQPEDGPTRYNADGIPLRMDR